jgi:ubiquinone/menaquinone biosynthesis C-methylase UbiE
MQRQLVDWAFRQLYTRFAWSYDAVAALVSGGRWQHWAAAALPVLRGRVLELGCGPGRLQALPRPPAVSLLVGLDLSAQMVRLARRNAPRALLTRADALQLPFAAGSFEMICATFPTAWLLRAEAQRELRRVLIPGGRIVVIDRGSLPAGPYQRLVALVYRLVWGRAVAAEALPATVALGGLEFAVEQVWAADGSSVLRMIAERPDDED